MIEYPAFFHTPQGIAWNSADRLWAEGQKDGDSRDLDTAWRQIFGVSRLQAEREDWRVDAGEYGTIIAYKAKYGSLRLARVNEWGQGEIRIS